MGGVKGTNRLEPTPTELQAEIDKANAEAKEAKAIA